MRIPRIYTSQALSSGNELQLEERAAHYLGQVLRMKVSCACLTAMAATIVRQ